MTTTYTLPPILAVAMSTDRGELCTAFANSIRAENELAATLAQLIGDLLNDRRNKQNELIALSDSLKQTRKQFEAFSTRVEKAMNAANAESADETDDE